jgi:hypothetical protein
MTCICVAFVCLLFICSPLSSILSVDPEDAVDPEYDYVDDDPSFSVELPGKQTPLDHSDIAHFLFSLLLALEGRSSVGVLSVYPILLHSLFLLTAVDTLPALLLCLV